MSLRLAFVEIARVAIWLDVISARPSMLQIKAAVCQRFHLSPLSMVSNRRHRTIARPRQIAMYLSREMTACSLPQIGRAFGDRDHSTVIHACKQVERLRAEDAAFDGDVCSIRDALSSATRRHHVNLGAAIAGHEADLAKRASR